MKQKEEKLYYRFVTTISKLPKLFLGLIPRYFVMKMKNKKIVITLETKEENE